MTLSRATFIALSCLTIFPAPRAAAEVWGYVDEQGRPHIATEKLDERYQLFFKGRSSADVIEPPATESQDDSFKKTAIYQRIAKHPNAKRYEAMIERHAKRQNIDVALVKAVIAVESAFEPQVISPKGAVGLMQVIPDTAQRYGVNDDKRRTVVEKLIDPSINVDVGTRHLRAMLAMFAGDVGLALAAYNAGEGAVMRYENRIPPYPETQEYVKLVQQFYTMFKPPPPRRAVSKPGRITIPRLGQASTPN